MVRELANVLMCQLQHCSQDYNLSSYIIHEWRDLQCEIYPERQIFRKDFMAHLLLEFLRKDSCEEVAERNICSHVRDACTGF